MSTTARYRQVATRVARPDADAAPAPATCPANGDGRHTRERASRRSGRERCACGAWRRHAEWYDSGTDTWHVELSDWTAATSRGAHGHVTTTLTMETVT